MSLSKTTKSYSYRSVGGGHGNTDINMEYAADLSALSRLEVSRFSNVRVFSRSTPTLCIDGPREIGLRNDSSELQSRSHNSFEFSNHQAGHIHR